MTKKVGSINNITRGTTPAIDAAKNIQPTGVTAISNISKTTATQNIRAVRRATRPMTFEEREHLLKLINEEAEKLFTTDALTEKQKETAKNAVKMALDASIVEDEND